MFPKLRPIVLGATCFILITVVCSTLGAIGYGDRFNILALYLAAGAASFLTGYLVRDRFGASMIILGVVMAGTLAALNLVRSYIGLHSDLGGLRMVPTVFWLYVPICVGLSLFIGSAGHQLHEYLSRHREDYDETQ